MIDAAKYLPAIERAADDVHRKADYGHAAIEGALTDARFGFEAMVRGDHPEASGNDVRALVGMMLDGASKLVIARLRHEGEAARTMANLLAAAPQTMRPPANDG